MFFEAIQAQTEHQEKFFIGIIEEMLKAFGLKHPPEKCYRLTVAFKEILSVLAVGLKTEWDQGSGIGLIPEIVTIHGITIGCESSDDIPSNSATIQLETEGGSQVLLGRWMDLFGERIDIWEPHYPYLFPPEALDRIQKAFAKNASQEGQKIKWPSDLT